MLPYAKPNNFLIFSKAVVWHSVWSMIRLTFALLVRLPGRKTNACGILRWRLRRFLLHSDRRRSHQGRVSGHFFDEDDVVVSSVVASLRLGLAGGGDFSHLKGRKV